ncbi:MAG TPA: hypothetical protein VIG98_06810 [Bacillus sp. (in: firmicutes)]
MVNLLVGEIESEDSIVLLQALICFHISMLANAEAPLIAAFVRDHQLWLKDVVKKYT